jgi:anti-sigma regulatory factor (Ser/Thr protein kinase)
MGAPPAFRTSLRNRAAELERVQHDLAGFLEGEGVDEAIRGELRLVCEEVLVNIISYAFADGAEERIEVVASIASGRVVIEFRDGGRPFDPLRAPAPDLDRADGERPIGGLGIHLVRQLADRVEYRRLADVNLLRIERALRRP